MCPLSAQLGMRSQPWDPTCEAKGTMALKEQVRKRKRSRGDKAGVEGAWVALIVLCSMLVLAAIWLAFSDNYDWLLK